MLHRRHRLQLRASTRRERPENTQLFIITPPRFPTILPRLREEHEHAPLLFHAPQRLAVPTHHEADAVARDRIRRVVAPRSFRVDRDRSYSLLLDEVDVVDGMVAPVWKSNFGRPTPSTRWLLDGLEVHKGPRNISTQDRTGTPSRSA